MDIGKVKLTKKKKKDFLIQNTLHWVTDYVLGEHILSRGASEPISIYTTNAI